MVSWHCFTGIKLHFRYASLILLAVYLETVLLLFFRGDAVIAAHLMEYCAFQDVFKRGYDNSGNTVGEVDQIPRVEKLQWEINYDLEVS